MGQVAFTRIAVFELLREHGPLHIGALAELLNKNRSSVESAVRIAHQKKLLHISGWHRNLGTGGRWGAVYSLGHGQDRKPPQLDSQKDAAERYRQKYRELIRRKDNARRGKPVDPWLALLGAA